MLKKIIFSLLILFASSAAFGGIYSGNNKGNSLGGHAPKSSSFLGNTIYLVPVIAGAVLTTIHSIHSKIFKSDADTDKTNPDSANKILKELNGHEKPSNPIEDERPRHYYERQADKEKESLKKVQRYYFTKPGSHDEMENKKVRYDGEDNNLDEISMRRGSRVTRKEFVVENIPDHFPGGDPGDIDPDGHERKPKRKNGNSRWSFGGITRLSKNKDEDGREVDSSNEDTKSEAVTGVEGSAEVEEVEVFNIYELRELTKSDKTRIRLFAVNVFNNPTEKSEASDIVTSLLMKGRIEELFFATTYSGFLGQSYELTIGGKLLAALKKNRSLRGISFGGGWYDCNYDPADMFRVLADILNENRSSLQDIVLSNTR